MTRELSVLQRLENAVLGEWDFEAVPPARKRGLIEKVEQLENRMKWTLRIATIPLSVVFLKSLGVPTDRAYDVLEKGAKILGLM